jgi:hypothetical protein
MDLSAGFGAGLGDGLAGWLGTLASALCGASAQGSFAPGLPVGRKNSHRHYLTLGDGQPLFVTLVGGVTGVTVGELAHCCLLEAKRLLVALNLSVRASRGWQSFLK